MFGIYERHGRVYTEIVSDCSAKTLQAIIRGRVSPESVVHTDGWRGYDGLVDVTVASSELPDFDGDGSTIPDYYIDGVDDSTGIIELQLRSERSGKGEGRTYTVNITASDESGNQSEAHVEIKAPHDKRKK